MVESIVLQQAVNLTVDSFFEEQVSELEKLLPAVTEKNEFTNKAPPAPVYQIANASLWERIFSMYAFPEMKRERRAIEYEIRWLQNHQGYVQRVQHRAQPFLYEIVSQIGEAGLPGEIALLPIVESAFRPHAFSRGRASGIWQFTRGTAKRFGLHINSWYDGRRDLYASTGAAIRYLRKLHWQFKGDWLLALAAYNSGEGTVAKAIRRNRNLKKATEFWHLKLPNETRSYVPRLLAVAKVFRHSDQYGIDLLHIDDKPVVEVVTIDDQIDLAVAAKISQITLEELLHLNPGFSRWSTPPNGSYNLLVPIDRADILRSNLAALDADSRMGLIRHTVRKDETLGQIAINYGTSAAAIRSANNINGHIIHPGNKLMIPSKKVQAANYRPRAPQPIMPSPPIEVPANSEKILYTIRSGDSLWEISRKYYVSVEDLRRWNSLTKRSILRLDKTLTIWIPTVLSHASEQHIEAIEQNDPFNGLNYTVKKGDSLYLISRRFNVKIADLRKWNATTLGKYLKPGQKLVVRFDEPEPAAL